MLAPACRLRSEGYRAIGGLDRRLAVPGDRLVPGQVCVGGDELPSGGLRLEQLDRLLDEAAGSRVGEAEAHEAEAGLDPAYCHPLLAIAAHRKGQVERPRGLAQPAQLVECPCPLLEQGRALRRIRERELEGSCQLSLRSPRVESERAGTRQPEGPHGVPAQVRLLVAVTGGLVELERGQ